MKKTFAIILALAAAGLLASCTKDDDPKSLIVGTWDFVKQDATLVSQGEAYVDPSSLTDGFPDQYALTINIGTWTSTYIKDGKSVTSLTGIYIFKDDIIRFEADGAIYPPLHTGTDYSIDKLTRKELVLSCTYEYSNWQYAAPATREESQENTVYKVVLTFTRR